METQPKKESADAETQIMVYVALVIVMTLIIGTGYQYIFPLVDSDIQENKSNVYYTIYSDTANPFEETRITYYYIILERKKGWIKYREAGSRTIQYKDSVTFFRRYPFKYTEKP